MTFIGYLSAAIIFAAMWAMFATGRKELACDHFLGRHYVRYVPWRKTGLSVNGLCLLIAIGETALSIRAVYGIIIWDQNFKDKGVILPIVIYLITLILVGYVVIQIQKAGYVLT